MKRIEEEMFAAVWNGRNFKQANTEVKVNGFTVEVYLHGNLIYVADSATRSKKFSLAGWNTVTTRSRLRALGVNVCQRNYVPMYEGKEIDAYKFYRF